VRLYIFFSASIDQRISSITYHPGLQSGTSLSFRNFLYRINNKKKSKDNLKLYLNSEAEPSKIMLASIDGT
jgi:hypothetical protein